MKYFHPSLLTPVLIYFLLYSAIKLYFTISGNRETYSISEDANYQDRQNCLYHYCIRTICIVIRPFCVVIRPEEGPVPVGPSDRM